MNLNKKFITIGLVLLIFSWAGNVFFYEKHILKEPIFVRHYYEVESRMSVIRLYYIQNINSQEQVQSITFPEMGQEYTILTDNNINSDNRYYKLKCISIDLHDGNENKVPDNLKNKIITKATVTFTNGKVISEDIGKIYLYANNSNESNLIGEGGTLSRDTSFYMLKAVKDTKVTGLNVKFFNIVEDAISIRINEKSLKDIKFPLELKNGGNLKVSYAFKFKKDDIRRNNAYNFPIEILTEDAEGTKGNNLCIMNYWIQSPGEYDVQSLRIDRR